MGIKFGVTPLTSAPRGENLQQVCDEACEEMQLAEEVGFDSVMLPEHHQIREGQFTNPLMLGVAIAVRNEADPHQHLKSA